ncbi:flagellar basal body rod protein [Fictibacillus phosphorivorans]|uniref:lmo0954 family membrane protein n=1 Tax=Fictibacillus phosphorivorans TaxID=1221500 RepID=UPI00203BB85C|nr:flagellar basal body rod protein [Fictibacillus phosphorivorans]MCM3719569.1 flagellar basal body rod protein [Fictibacillus phosphorivorans]MCM3777260.1 flagellar basal body rod protein [Fictibacillus phosphorivorans]
MKKLGLLVVGGIAAIVLIANLGPMVGLAIGLAVMYYAYKKCVVAETGGKKFWWGALSVIGLCIAVANLPAILGAVAIYVLYLVYKKWNQSETIVEQTENDPFTNFEREWSKLKNS